METRANYTLIGAFVILAGIAAMGFVLWLGQSQFQREFDQYDIVFDGPITLERGAAVRYIGIKVGEVERIAIDRADISKVRARIRIDSQTPIKTDSVATIDFAGITGLTFIQIDAGSVSASILERRAGESVPVIKSEKTQLEELFRGGSEMMQSANKAIISVNALLSQDNIVRMENTLANLETISAKLAREEGLIDTATGTLASVGRAGDSFTAISGSIGQFSDNAATLVGDVRGELQGLVEEVRKVLGSADTAMDEGGKTATAMRAVLEGPAMTTLEDARAVSQDLRVLINRLDRLAREAEQNPQRFVVGEPIPYEEYRK